MSKKDADCIVIGAGLAGLSAAERLTAAGKRVVLLEARERVGGRTEGGALGGLEVDIGGQWVGPTQSRLLAQCERLGLRTMPQFATGQRLLEIGGRRRRFRGKIPRIGPLALLDADRAVRRINRCAQQVDTAKPWAAPMAAQWDDMTAAQWMDRNVRTRNARALVDILCRAIWAAEPSEISFLYFLTYIRAAGRLETLAEVHDDGAQQMRIVGGAFRVAQRLAERLPANTLHCNAAVQRIDQDAEGVTVHHSAGNHSAARAIVATAPSLANRIHFNPDLPLQRRQLQERMPMGSVIKVLLAYEKPFWRDAGLSGEVASHDGPLSPVFDASPEDGSVGMLVGFFEAEHGRRLATADSTQRRSEAVRCAVRYFGTAAANPLGYVEKNWIADPWSQGCYVGLAPPGVLGNWGEALREPDGRVHWAGTESATRWIGYMDGALESGERAADEVLARSA